jgi:peptidoglycan/LPS O-acetylase OafA/YrhL
MHENRKRRIMLLLSALVFAVGSLDALQSGDLVVGVPSLVAACLNLLAVRRVEVWPRTTAAGLHVINAVVAVAMGVSAVLSGKHYIQYAWWVAALIFLIAAVAAWKAGRREMNTES